MKSLEILRDEIDIIDQEILDLVGKRIEVVKEIGEYKKSANKPIRDEERENKKIALLVEQNKNSHVSKNVITKIWKTFFEIAYEIEK